MRRYYLRRSTGKFSTSRNSMRKLNLQGEIFGRLVVINQVASKGEKTRWNCLCKCGAKKIITGTVLKMGDTKSCGCLVKELVSKRFFKHGMSRDSFYKVFFALKDRCERKEHKFYSHYGGRGIKCLWKSFEEFKDDMYKSYLEHVEKFGRENTTIERIDNNGHYSLGNCKWATWLENGNNKRNNIYYKIGDEIFTASQASRILKCPRWEIVSLIKKKQFA